MIKTAVEWYEEINEKVPKLFERSSKIKYTDKEWEFVRLGMRLGQVGIWSELFEVSRERGYEIAVNQILMSYNYIEEAEKLLTEIEQRKGDQS